MTLFVATGFNSGIKEPEIFSSQAKVPSSVDAMLGPYGYPIKYQDILQASVSGCTTKPFFFNVSLRVNKISAGLFTIGLNNGGSNSIYYTVSRTGTTITINIVLNGSSYGSWTIGRLGWFTLGFEVGDTYIACYSNGILKYRSTSAIPGSPYNPTIFKAWFSQDNAANYVSLDNLVIGSGQYLGMIYIYPLMVQSKIYSEDVNTNENTFPIENGYAQNISDPAVDNWGETVFTSHQTNPIQSQKRYFTIKKLIPQEGIDIVKVLNLRLTSIYSAKADPGFTGYTKLIYKSPAFNVERSSSEDSIAYADGFKHTILNIETNPDTVKDWTIEDLNNLWVGFVNRSHNG
jgi:hypothetical protein